MSYARFGDPVGGEGDGGTVVTLLRRASQTGQSFLSMADKSATPSREDQALAWFVRMNSGDATDRDAAHFEAWLTADPAHRAEYEKLDGLWTELDALPDPRPSRSASPPGSLSRRGLLLGGAAVAGAAVVAVPLFGVSTALSADYRTGTGERRSVTASDGTRIDLDAGTAVAEDYSLRQRRLRLLEGRALFTVGDDPERPFEVACRDGVCRALRASFVVHRRSGDVAVAVEGGSVSVQADDTGPAELQAGQCLAYGAKGLGAVRTAAGDAAMAWRRGKLAFQDRPLDDVVADLNRYRDGTIVIADRSLAGLRVDGIFDADLPEAALQAILSTLPVRAWRLTDYLIVLRRA